MMNIGSLKENIERSMGQLRSRIIEADGKGPGTGEVDVSHVKAQLKKGEKFLNEDWKNMSPQRTNEISKWYLGILEDKTLSM